MRAAAGGGAAVAFSIPRDSFAEIPGETPQKINAAYSFGGAALQIKTIEQFLGLIEEHRITATMLVPSMLYALVDTTPFRFWPWLDRGARWPGVRRRSRRPSPSPVPSGT